MSRTSLLQFLLPLAFLISATDKAAAQPITYSAIIQAADSSSQVKGLFMGLIDHLPNADVMHDRNSDTLTIVTETPITFEELYAIVLAAGFELISLGSN